MDSGSLATNKASMFSYVPAVDSSYSWLITTAALICYSISMGSWWTNGVFFVSLLEEFGHDRATTGIVSTITILVYSFGGVPAGYMVNWWGCRAVALAGGFSLGLSYFFSSYTLALWQIFLTDGFLKGLGGILLLQTSFAIVAKYHVKFRTLANSLVSCGSGFGTFFGVLFEALTRHYGWRTACRVIGLIFLVLVSLSVTSYAPITIAEGGSEKSAKPLSSKKLLGRTSFKFFLISYFFNTYSVVNTYIIDFAIVEGLSSSDAARLLIFWGIFDIVGKLVVGLSKSGKFGRLRMLTAAHATMAISCWFLVLPPIGLSANQVCLIFISVYGFCSGITWNLLATCTADVYGAENVPLGVGWAYTVHAPANLITLPLLGMIVDSANGDYTLAIILISGISTLACIATYLFMLYAVKTLRVENVQRTLTDQPTRRKNTSISVSFESVKTLRVENVQKTLTDQPTRRENTSISVSFESSSDEEQVSPTYNIKTQGMLIKLKDVL